MAIAEAPNAIFYPDSDGNPMSDNTRQFQWITVIKSGLETLFADDPDVFVAGDLLWYAVEGRPNIRVAPDVLVAFGRPKGYRGSYKQWEEGNVPPQIVFEILSPGNRFSEMMDKFLFYERRGVEEYYLYDPEPSGGLAGKFEAWARSNAELQSVPFVHDFVSPLLGVRFDLTGTELVIFRPDGERFKTHEELFLERNQARQERDTAERERTVAERQRDQEREARRVAEEKAARLAEQLRALGIEPDTTA